MANVYYSPERFDLVPLAELELAEPDYSYDTLVVWRHKTTGKLYWAHDSGCSCPTPFEDYTWETLPRLETARDYATMEDVARTADNKTEMRAFLRKVRRAYGASAS